MTNHPRTTLLAITLSAVGFTTTAQADSGKPGRKGTVTAYAPGPLTVLESRQCTRTRLSWNYTTCGRLLRKSVKSKLCSRLGKGLHRYYYQVGNRKKSRSSVYCKYRSARQGPVTEPSHGPANNPPPRTERPRKSQPGGRGMVVAYFPTRLDTFDSQRCTRRGRTYVYSTCGRVLRSRVKRRVCARLGKGMQHYYVRIGDSKKRKSQVYCR